MAVDVLRRTIDGTTVDASAVGSEILSRFVEDAQRAAAERGANLRDYACTLLFAAVSRHWYVAGHIGDGVIAIERDGEMSVLSAPERGEFANETTFLTSVDAQVRLRAFSGAASGVQSFALMSDGPQHALYDTRTQSVGAAIRKMCHWFDTNPVAVVRDALAKNLGGIVREQTHDDCSVALMRRVAVNSETLAAASSDFQRDVLGCKTLRALQARKAILAVVDGEGSAAEIARATGLSASTVRRHLRELRPLLAD